MADPELLLTIDGIDHTPYIWDWSTLTLSDNVNGYAQLSVTIRQPWGSVTTVADYAIVRLVNLVTSTVLFEGVASGGPRPQRDIDPALTETDIAAVDMGSLLSTSVIQEAGWTTSGAIFYNVRRVVGCLVDARVDTTCTDQTGPDWSNSDYPGTIAYGTPAPQAIQAVTATAGGVQYPWVLKWYPGTGFVWQLPTTAWRGASPVQFTAAAQSPSRMATTHDNTSLASHAVFRDSVDSHPWLLPNPYGAGGSARTNGFVVVRDTVKVPFTVDYAVTPTNLITPWVFAINDSTDYTTMTLPMTTYDLRVGETLTFGNARTGDVSGTITAVQTQFRSGVLDTTTGTYPWFLDGAKSLDGTWTLDAARSATIERHPRIHTVSVSGVPRSFIARYRWAVGAKS